MRKAALERSVSIVIPTYQGAAYIEEVLAAIDSQAYGGPVEVLVIDSGSTDGTPEMAASRGVRVHRIDNRDFNHGRTRNLGAAMTTGRFIVFLSQDATPADERWLGELVEACSDPAVAGACSRHLARPDCPLPVARALAEEWPLGRPRAAVFGPVPADQDPGYIPFSDTSSCLKREVWVRYPLAEIWFAEDLEWARRVVRAGYRVVYTPASRVLHSHHDGFWTTLRNNVDHHAAMARLLPAGAGGSHRPRSSSSRRLLRALVGPVRAVLRDLRYALSRSDVRWRRRLALLVASPSYHGAVVAGMVIGRWGGPVARRLSRHRRG